MSKLVKQVIGEMENMEEPEEAQEVQIAKRIISLTGQGSAGVLQAIRAEAQKLIDMHSLGTKRELPGGSAAWEAIQRAG